MLLWRQTDHKHDPFAADKRQSETVKSSSSGSKILPDPRTPHARRILSGSDKVSNANDAIAAAIKTVAF